MDSFAARIKILLLSAAAGVVAGAVTSAFLHLLFLSTAYREAHRGLIWFLPLAGLLIGWVYHAYGKEAVRGHNLILDEIHRPKNTVPLRMVPLIFGGTIVTHLFGGSAGREGTAVQIGGSLADRVAKLAGISGEGRRRLLLAGLGAGFGSALGAPWAGAVFGIEVIHVGKLDFRAVPETLIASFIAYWTCILLRTPHTVYPTADIGAFEFRFLLWVALAGLSFGLAARAFVLLVHFIEKLARKALPNRVWLPFAGGILIAVLFYFEGTYRYAGLGLSHIQDALIARANYADPALKGFFTALTLATGFKGGEFIPLVFIGTTLGSALSGILPLPLTLLAALGFGAVFGAAANVPLACAVMVMEVFGWHYGLYALVAGYAAFLVSGPHGIYSAQPKAFRKI
jgi:H+/Cl- antiporter ClcA